MRLFKPSKNGLLPPEPPLHGELALATIERPEGDANEDRMAAWEDERGRLVLAVADGAGGHANGGKAAEMAIASIASALRAGSDAEDLRVPVLDAFEEANRRILELGGGAATTLAVAIVEGLSFRTLHVGDSLIMVVGARGAVRLQTVSHSPVGYAVEAGVIEPEDAIHHEELNLVSNMLGSHDMHVEVRAPMLLRQYDTVLLASDGVADNLHLEEITSCIRKGRLSVACQALLDGCRRRMLDPRASDPSKPDDLTIVLYRPHRRRYS